MKIYQFSNSQKLKVSIEDAWNFFSNPNNLPTITPDWLDFKITSQLPEKMYAGMIISYKVHPLFGIPVNWVTEITQVKEPNYFVDEQRFGPYKFWHHQHHFKETNEGVEMTDLINYSLPFDPLSRLINSFIVQKKVSDIFSYREKVLEKMFAK